MNPLGIHALVLAAGWNRKEAVRAIERAAALDYGYLEIPLIDPGAIDVRRTRKALEKAGLRPVASLGLGPDTDISSGDPAVVSRGETLLGDALSVARDLGSTMLSGVLYSALGKYSIPATEIGRWNCIQVLGRLAEKAKASGMTIGIEPVNRYESNLVNTGDDALKLIDTIGAENMVVHLDSYHMNIEEGDPGALIARLGDRLGYVHVNESHRGYLGTGSVHFDGLFRALAEHGYDGVVTFEAFSAGIGDPGLHADLAVWRPLFDDPDDLARHARIFMMNMMQRQIRPAEAASADHGAVRAASNGLNDAGPTAGKQGQDDRRFGWSRRLS